MTDVKDNKKSSLFDGWYHAPNIVTYVRIALVIVYIVLAVQAGPLGHTSGTKRWIAAILFIFAASTDKVDGYLARKYNQVTELGKLMDPIADKLLICSALVILSAYSELAWWITILFLIRELGITIMRFFVIDAGGKVIAANMAGKLKTVFECLGIGMMLLPLWLIPGVSSSVGNAYRIAGIVVVLLALVLCLYSGAVYVINTFGSADSAASAKSSSKRK